MGPRKQRCGFSPGFASHWLSWLNPNNNHDNDYHENQQQHQQASHTQTTPFSHLYSSLWHTKQAKEEGGATRLVVGNLTRNITEEHLNEIFSVYGKLKNVELAIDKRVNLPRGFAHVEYEEHGGAQKAIDFMHEGQMDGNVVR